MPPRVPSGNPGTCVSWLPEAARNVQPCGRLSRLPSAADSDVMGGQHVLLDERWGNLQGGGDVVEALRGVVRRKKIGAVDVHQKQIMDRVFVLLAIQPVKQLAVGDVLRGGKLVERIFQVRDQ